MEFILEKYPCSLCNADSTSTLLNKQGFSIVKCDHCGFVYVNPRVKNEQLAVIYEHSYFRNKDYGYVSYEQEKNLRLKNFERWLNDATPFITAGKTVLALDVGCAAGYCLDVMKQKGWDTEGLELDEEMCGILQKNGYAVSKTHLEDFNTGNRYNMITLFDVIEHIPHIDTAFRKLHSLLAEGGVVVMVTPNHNSFQRRLFGKKWFQYKPIEHIQYFTKQSLNEFAERNGLEMIHCSSCGQYADSNFIINRLNYYHFSFFSKFFNRLFSILSLKNRYFYTDTGSLFVVFKAKQR
jgi:2-polyprenyl-3-methyl-5-hydroxy-6-metoxy-1,4-benzoquinol methylase